MRLVDKGLGPSIPGVQVPIELYWVLTDPTPLAGMKYPAKDFPWSNLKAAGFSHLVSLHPGPYDPAPLIMPFSELLEDLGGGGPPRDAIQERARIKKAVEALVRTMQSGNGTVVHCAGGRGRSGTVLGCALREFGFGANETVGYLDRLHKARGRPGWPESPWQSSLVHEWGSDA